MSLWNHQIQCYSNTHSPNTQSTTAIVQSVFRTVILFVYPCRRDVVFTRGLLSSLHCPHSHNAHYYQFSHSFWESRRTQKGKNLIGRTGYENLSSYEFNTKTRSHKFCKACGSSILVGFEQISEKRTQGRTNWLSM